MRRATVNKIVSPPEDLFWAQLTKAKPITASLRPLAAVRYPIMTQWDLPQAHTRMPLLRSMRRQVMTGVTSISTKCSTSNFLTLRGWKAFESYHEQQKSQFDPPTTHESDERFIV